MRELEIENAIVMYGFLKKQHPFRLIKDYSRIKAKYCVNMKIVVDL